jgi:PncC family amidohydrolase
MPLPPLHGLRVEDLINQARIDAHMSGYELLQKLNDNQLQVATAESLTAGLMFSTLVDIPISGWNKYGCFGVYDTDAKRVFLGVDVEDVYTHRCAKQMAVGILRNSNATFAIAVTGNAMPYQGIGENIIKGASQVGEVFIGIACYIDSGSKILVSTSVINACQDANICKTWLSSIKSENAIEKTCKQTGICTDDFKTLSDGLNYLEITSLLATYIRNKTTAVAFKQATEFIDAHKEKICKPTFVKNLVLNDVARQDQRNNVHLIHRQDSIQCTNENLCNEKLREGDDGKRLYSISGGKNPRTRVKSNKSQKNSTVNKNVPKQKTTKAKK